MTAVQTTDIAPRRAVGQLPPEIQQAIEMRRARNLAAAQIAGLSWGEKIGVDERRAVAEWGQQFRVDVSTEIHLLGGRIYINAALYLRRLGEMIGEGLVEYAVADHVEDDPRLKLLGGEGEGEWNRRLRERLKHGIPDACASAVVFRVKLRTMNSEVVGSKWCGTGKKNQYGKFADPVGEEFPVETSESRAARRCMRQLTSHLPPVQKEAMDALERSAEALSLRVSASRQEVKAREVEARRPSPMLAAPADADDPYSLGAGTTETVSEVKSATTRAESDERVDRASPQGSPVARQQSASAPDPSPAPPAERKKLTAEEQFKMPFSWGSSPVGTPLGLVLTSDLNGALQWAMKNGASAEFVDAASVVLEDRRYEEEKGG